MNPAIEYDRCQWQKGQQLFVVPKLVSEEFRCAGLLYFVLFLVSEKDRYIKFESNQKLEYSDGSKGQLLIYVFSPLVKL